LEDDMYYSLKKTTRLHREKECAVIFSADDLAGMHYSHPLHALILALCDGTRRREDLRDLVAESLTGLAESAESLVGDTLERFGELLRATPAPVAPERVYDPLEFAYEPQGDPNLRRLSVPVEIAWLVTQRCPYDCLYCCIETLPAKRRAEAEMDTAESLAFLEDCAATGVQAVILHGGEPFLRRDLPELIAFMLRQGIHVRASTKLRLPDSTVERLAAAGLEELQVSVDSPDPETADTLVGRAHYLDRAFHNIETLQRHGLRVRTNTVVTGRNVRQVPALVREVAARGVRRVTLSGYLRSFHKHQDSHFPGREDLRAMAGEVRRIEQETEGLKVEMCPLESQREMSLCQAGYASCSGGKTGGVVGPDGRVSFCDRLLSFPQAIVGNVRESSLREIWNGERLLAFVEPEPASFAGTACSGCGLRQVCDQRMRCSYRSLMVDQRMFGPDYLCPVMPEPPLRFF
jgi:radical SAM protein with 4Fe4S-binding SPASM domain